MSDINNNRYLFRGKRVDNGEWIEGDLMQNYIHHEGFLTIVKSGCIYHKVMPETVGQCTGYGCQDKNNIVQKVFEGDIFEFDKNEWGGDGNIHVVSWDAENAAWCFGGGTIRGDMGFRTLIGNIHDNPELLS